MIKTAMTFMSLTTALFLTFGTAARADQAADWVFMDLGEVIVTGNPTDGYLYVPGARALIDDLRAAGIKVALISNIPESWGASCDAKFNFLQTFIGQHLREPVPFDWAALATVILPPFDRYRKPVPFLFMNALATACPGKALFMGEDAGEIQAAAAMGFATINTSATPDLPTAAQIRAALDLEFSFTHPQDCAFDQLLNDLLLPADLGQVSGCVLTP